MTIGELVDVGATTLYVERRGSGTALLFIPGGGTDASHFADVATLLANDFHTITYDRRGYHRSPAPADWTATSIGEQADDVAALIRTLELGRPAVWGGSIGGLVLLDLIHRHPELVSAAVIHEPPLFTLLDDEPKFLAGLAAMADRARIDGPRAVMADHAKAELGDTFARLTPDARERLLANADTFLLRDVPGLVRSPPVGHTCAVPTAVLRSPENDRTPSGRAAAELAGLLGVPLEFTPGGHVPYATEPQATAATIRSTLRRLIAE